MTDTDTYSPWLSLEHEGLLLLVSLPAFTVIGFWLDVNIHWGVGFIPFMVWFIWFTAWASKGGMPPRF